MHPWNDMTTESSLRIPRGMIGFPGLCRYRFVRSQEENPFSLLVCEEKPQVRFPLVDPLLIRPGYGPLIPAGVREELDPEGKGGTEMLAVVHAPEEAAEMTVNLRAPILLNENSGLGAQVLLEDGDYPVAARLAEEWVRERTEMLTI